MARLNTLNIIMILIIIFIMVYFINAFIDKYSSVKYTLVIESDGVAERVIDVYYSKHYFSYIINLNGSPIEIEGHNSFIRYLDDNIPSDKTAKLYIGDIKSDKEIKHIINIR